MESYELITLKSCRGCLREVPTIRYFTKVTVAYERRWFTSGGRTLSFDCVNRKNFSNFEHPV